MILKWIRNICLILLGSILIVVIFSICLFAWGAWNDEWSGYNASLLPSDGSCNVAIIPIAGEIIPYAGANFDGVTIASELPPSVDPDTVAATLRDYELNPGIRGVLLRIDSPGGAPAASEIIANVLKKSALPTAALIREIGTSGGYLIATGADTIIASPFSDVGSIGVTMSYLDGVSQNEQEGINFVSLASAPYKDYGNPNKELTSEERAILERDLKIYHEQFVKEVSENRNLPLEEVAQLADGASMPGSLALEHKLIDSLGDQDTARSWFAEKLELTPEEVVFCE